jgi:streptogramin lyase
MLRAHRPLVLFLAGLTTLLLPACNCGGPIQSPISQSKLVFTAQPSNTAVGAHINPSVIVTAEDGSGNVVPGFPSTVTLKLANNPSSATLSGTLTVTPNQGVATFSDLSIDKAGSAYTLNASTMDFEFKAATSTSFDVTSGTHAISGTVSGAISAGVTMSLTGASSATTTTGATGSYNFGGLGGGTYTVTPSLAGYTFTPGNLTVTVNGADVTGEDFTASHTSATHHIYVTDGNMKGVVRIDDINGTNWTALVDAGTNFFAYPWGIYVDTAENLYVTDSNRIVLTTMSGVPWNTISQNGAQTDQFVGLEGIALDAAGNIYVTDWGFAGSTGKARVVQIDGGTWTSLGTYGSGVGQFGCPGMIYVDSSTPPFIYVADRCNNRIVQTTMSGTPWNVVTHNAADAGDSLTNPRGISVDSSGVLWIADEANGRIVATTMSGSPWAAFAIEQSDGGEIAPTGIYAEPTGPVYVVGYRNHNTLQQFMPTTTSWTIFSSGPQNQTFTQTNGVFVR